MRLLTQSRKLITGGKGRQNRRMLKWAKSTSLGNFNGVFERLGQIGKQSAHFFG